MAFRDTYLPGQGGTGQAGASSLVLLVDPPGLCLRVRLPTAASAIESGMAGSWPPMAAWLATHIVTAL